MECLFRFRAMQIVFFVFPSLPGVFDARFARPVRFFFPRAIQRVDMLFPACSTRGHACCQNWGYSAWTERFNAWQSIPLDVLVLFVCLGGIHWSFMFAQGP